MSDEITVEIFNYLVELAAFELSDEEAEYLRKQLNNQLKSIHELDLIPLDPSTPLTSHGVNFTPDNSPNLREDRLASNPHPKDLVDCAPETEDGYIIVPDLPKKDLK